ncbi:MAG TPA: DNA polymerase III subunit delta [Leptolyngbyaceae cyanobacterium M33_DOE_097]|uniref:DNA polymerase III subunit delta n=1 Tax=Oscillatoriales cyanobacterium SpSt-418 TaxID=2282169 RepID=A0A7C3KIV2_9CYAN|nr:DNA polymerase III subunit delta [Leptolyngbyaceae cyanobacterium M33_DOE_097]
MSIFVYWGDDEFAIAQAVLAIRQKAIDPSWEGFNYEKINSDQPDAVTYALNQAMTPPFGAGNRLVWLAETSVCQRCPEGVLAELERSLPQIPETSVLLLTCAGKPDGRLKSTKLLQQYGEVREFAVIPPWKTELLVKQVQQTAQSLGVKLTKTAIEQLAEAVGSNTRQLYSELEKLRLYAGANQKPLDEATVAQLVTTTSQSTIQLAAAIRQGHAAIALDLVADLLRQNEPALMIARSLITQFRTWAWVKLLLETGERDERAIAEMAEIGNPKRIYFLKQEVGHLSATNLLQTLPILLELDAGLKSGSDELMILQTKVIELCQVCRAR